MKPIADLYFDLKALRVNIENRSIIMKHVPDDYTKRVLRDRNKTDRREFRRIKFQLFLKWLSFWLFDCGYIYPLMALICFLIYLIVKFYV